MRSFLSVKLLLTLMLAACGQSSERVDEEAAENENTEEDDNMEKKEYLVQFNQEVGNNHLEKFDLEEGDILNTFTINEMKLIEMSEAQIGRLMRADLIEFIEKNSEVSIPENPGDQDSQK